MKKLSKRKGHYALKETVYSLPTEQREQIMLLYIMNQQTEWVGKHLINYYLNRVVPIRQIVFQPESVPCDVIEKRKSLKSLIKDHMILM